MIAAWALFPLFGSIKLVVFVNHQFVVWYQNKNRWNCCHWSHTGKENHEMEWMSGTFLRHQSSRSSKPTKKTLKFLTECCQGGIAFLLWISMFIKCSLMFHCLYMYNTPHTFWQTPKSKVPWRDSSPNFGLGVFFRNSFSAHPPIHPSTHPPPRESLCELPKLETKESP